MKIMSVDYGDARTGIAFCDKNEILATAFATINESYQPKLIEKIKEIISSQNPEMIEKAKAELKARLQDNSYKCLIPKDVLPHISNVE